MFSLLYVSRSRIVSDGSSPPAAVAEIVDYSVRYNGEHGITGGLIWTPRYFAQAIEGGREAVQALYGRIVRDTRHEEVLLVDTCDLVERAFPGWSLAYSGGTSYVQERLARVHASGHQTDQSEIQTVRALLRELTEAGGVSH